MLFLLVPYNRVRWIFINEPVISASIEPFWVHNDASSVKFPEHCYPSHAIRGITRGQAVLLNAWKFALLSSAPAHRIEHNNTINKAFLSKKRTTTKIHFNNLLFFHFRYHSESIRVFLHRVIIILIRRREKGRKKSRISRGARCIIKRHYSRSILSLNDLVLSLSTTTYSRWCTYHAIAHFYLPSIQHAHEGSTSTP